MKNLSLFLLISLFLGFQPTAQAQNFSLEFDGDDDEVQIPLNQGFLGENFTIEGWFKCNQTGVHQVIFSGFLNPSVSSVVVYVEIEETGDLRFLYRPEGTFTNSFEVFSTQTVDDGEWHHFAVVKEDNRLLKMYLNGILENLTCIVATNIAQPIYIDFGANRFSPADSYRNFNGNLDDLKTWTIAKSNREILADYKKEHTGTEEGLYNNYKFDVPSDTIFDCSINKNHGIRVGGSGSNDKPQFSSDGPALTNADCGFFFVGTDDELLGRDQQIQIYPNPTDQEAVISTGNIEKSDAQIFNQAGQLVRQFKIEGGVSKFSTANLPAGMYELRVVSREGIAVAKFVKR